MTSNEADNLNNEIIDNMADDDNSSNESLDKKHEHDADVRRRIEDLLEKKRLKDQLDDCEDW